MLETSFGCRNPDCDEGKPEKDPNQPKCAFMEKCVSSCAAYGKVCPCAARAAGRAAHRAIEKLYMDSKIFKEKPAYEYLDADDLVIGRKLGEGGFSVVHLVSLKTGKEKGQDFAIKYLKRTVMVDQHAFELGAADLAIESNFLSKLNNKHIVKLHGVTAGSVESNVATGKECGFFIIVDRLFDTLEKKIEYWKEDAERHHGNVLTRLTNDFKEKRRAALVLRLKIAIEVAEAMIYLHSLDIIYRDLKPDNIGFDETGAVKIFDFGLAKEYKEKYVSGGYKLTGNTGSRRYMAPEVAKEQHYGPAVDVFSFGIMLHEMTSLEKPFAGYSANKHMMQVVMGGERPRLDGHSTSWFPMDLQWLMKKCWATDPSERPTFEVVKTTLEDIVGSLSGNGAKSPLKKARVPRIRQQSGGVAFSPSSPKSIVGRITLDAEDVPDFKNIKPAARPQRQTKSLGILRK